jgi:alpha-ketoglutarate-dependent taurine dioxygenase
MMSFDCIRHHLLFPDHNAVACFERSDQRIDAFEWATAHPAEIRQRLLASGAVLFRGFGIESPERFNAFVRIFHRKLLDYEHGSSPRRKVLGNVYSSTEMPPSERIPLHNEMSYTTRWPLKLWFYCHRASPVGGETPLCDSRAVYRRLPVDLRERFATRGVMYVRNYLPGFHPTWQEAFQRDQRADIEAFLTARAIDFEWLDDDRLRTREVCQAIANHPLTGEPVWMNQAHLFHVSSLRPAVREALLASFSLDDLPRNACYGDGSAFAPDELATIRDAYGAEALVFPWRAGDVLLVDNMLMAHGRNPFSGPRQVLVAMAEAHDKECIHGTP